MRIASDSAAPGTVALLSALCHVAACRGDELAPWSATEGDSATTGAPGADLGCQETVYPLPGAPFTVAGPKAFAVPVDETCELLDLELEAFSVMVYHPEPLPATPLPVLIMTNGAGQRADRYEHILRPLAAMGFIVASVQSLGGVEQRTNTLKCALRWLRKDWNVENQAAHPGDEPANFSCDLALMGHGQGGAAAFAAGNDLYTIPWHDIDPLGFDMELRAVVGIAPRFEQGELSSYSGEASVPFLAIMGSTDEYVPGQAITAYDNMVFETSRTADDAGKLLLWPYDVPHDAFGGVARSVPGGDKGRAIAAGFIPSFLDLFVMGNEAQHPIFTGEQLPPALSGSIDEWWSHLEPAFTELGRRPVIARDFVVDQRDHPGSRQPLDDFEGGGTFSASLDVKQTKVDLQSTLSKPEISGAHFSEVLKVNWGGLQLGGDVTWMLGGGAGLSLADLSFFSLRVGQELRLADPAICALPEMDPRRAALTLIVRLEDSMGNTTEVPLGPIIQQDARSVFAPGGTDPRCVWSQFMQTLRLPIDSFCEPGFDIGSVVSLTIEFPDLGFETAVFMDTLEFTRHPLDGAHLCI